MSTVMVRLARWYFSRCPIGKGKWTLWRRFVHSLTYRSFAEGPYETAYEFKMWLDAREPIDRFIYFWGAWEPDEAWLIHRLLRPGDVFVDVGANEGFHSLLAARRVGPAGRVVAFEPVPPTIERLRRNIDLNGMRNLDVIEAACVDAPTTIELSRRRDERSSGVYSMRTRSSDCWAVSGVRLDDALQSLQEPIRLVKMDIEGAEMLALAGFRRHLGRSDAPLLLCEVTNSFLESMGTSARSLYGFMAEFGYLAYLMRRRTLVPMDLDWAAGQFQLNVLFVKGVDADTLLPAG